MHKDRKKHTRISYAVPLCALSAALSLSISACSSKGCKDYTVQMRQHYVEYSEDYDYWDVLTVEYPQLKDTGLEFEDALNERLYDAAMDRVNYWHLSPDEDVRAFQEEHFSIFCSDVVCNIPFHSQYLLCADYLELYSAGNPAWYTSFTERCLNLDLVTGEAYELSDIIDINEDFIKLWLKAAQEKYGDVFDGSDEETAFFLSWFLNEDAETSERYDLHTFFYPTAQDFFVIGFAYDPKPDTIRGSMTGPPDNTYSARLTASTLEPFRTESDFWSQYEISESTGQIIECKDKQENLWLGEGAGVWNYWKEQDQ